MFVGQANALSGRNWIAAGVKNQPDKKLAAIMDRQQGEDALEAARAKVGKLRDQLEGFTDPKLEKLAYGFQQRASAYTASQKELEYSQNQLDQYNALSGQRDGVQKELDEARASYQETPDGRLAEHISNLEKSLADVDGRIDALVENSNRHTPSTGGVIDRTTGLGGEKGSAYTRENFAARMGNMVDGLKTETESRKQDLIDYCEHHGVTLYQMEKYVSGKSTLSGALLTARQELYTMLQESGEDAERFINERV